MSGPFFQDPIDSEDLIARQTQWARARALRRRLMVIGALVVLLLGLVVMLAVPRIKARRARQFAEQAGSLQEQGKMREALNNAYLAVQMGPDLPESRRALAAVLFAANREEGIPVLQKLIEEGGGTSQDRLDLSEGALHFGNLPLAEKEASWLLQEKKKEAGALFVMAGVRLAQNRIGEAKDLLQKSLAAGGDANVAVALARVEFSENTPEANASAVALLTPLAAQKDAAGLAALMTLLESPAMTSSEVPTWIEAVRTHPLARTEEKLTAANAEIRWDPKAYVDIIRKTIAAFLGGTPERRVKLGRWLNQKSEYAAVLQIIPLEEAMRRKDLFLIRLDAMAGKGDWKDVAEVLRTPALPLQAPVALLYRGRAAKETGDLKAADAFYRNAVTEGVAEPEMWSYVTNYLTRIGENQLLQEELKRLTESQMTTGGSFAAAATTTTEDRNFKPDDPAARASRRAFAALVPIAHRKQDAAELHALYDQMAQLLPGDPAVQNDARYYAALAGKNADLVGARKLVEANPKTLAYRITLAMTLFKDGKPAEALHVFDGITLDTTQLEPRQRIVLAAVLGANKREAEARQLASSVAEDSATTQEEALIRPWRDEKNVERSDD